MQSPYQWKIVCSQVMSTVCLLSGTTILIPAATAAELPCEVMLSRAEVNIGRVSPVDVNPRNLIHGELSLGKHTSTLNVVCTTPSRFAIVFRAAAKSETSYRLNDDTTSLSLVLTQAQADGHFATFASMLEAERNGASMPLLPGDGARPQVAGQHIAVSRFSAVVEIAPFLDAARLKSPSDRTLDGKGFFEVVPY